MSSPAKPIEPDSEDPPSPCVGVCRLSEITGLCDGCCRTLDEIAQWISYAHAEKHAVLRLVAQRRARVGFVPIPEATC